MQNINRRLADFRRHLCHENDQWTNDDMLNDKDVTSIGLFPLSRIFFHPQPLLPLVLKVAQTNLLCATPAIPASRAVSRNRPRVRDFGHHVPGCCNQFRNKMKQNEKARSFLKALQQPVNFSTQATVFRHECQARVKNAPETQIKSAPSPAQLAWCTFISR